MHLITGLGVGGAETSLYRLIENFPDPGAEHIVVSLGGEEVFSRRIRETLGRTVYCLGGRASAIALDVPRLTRRVRPDVVQAWMHHAGAASILSRATTLRTPILWNVRQSLYSLSDEKPLTSLTIRFAAALSKIPRIIIYNSFTGAAQHEALGFARDRTRVVPNGFDVEEYKPDPEARRRIRAELGVSNEIPLVGLLARNHPQKDYATFLRATAKVSAARPETHFLIAGSNSDAADVVNSVRALGLSGAMHLLGERNDVRHVAAALDAAVQSSWREAFPNTVGEAMACGIPCVVTDVGDTATVVGDTGVVVPLQDPDAMARGVLELLERPDRQMLGMRARQRISEKYSLSRTVQTYYDLYKYVLRG